MQEQENQSPNGPKTPLSPLHCRENQPIIHLSLLQSSQGKSASSSLVQVKYPSPAGPKAVKSSSRKFLITGLTASLARFFTSSTRLSNLRRLSLEYNVPLLASLEVLRKRFNSSCGRYDAEELEPMRRYILPVLKGPLGGGLAGGGGRRWEVT